MKKRADDNNKQSEIYSTYDVKHSIHHTPNQKDYKLYLTT